VADNQQKMSKRAIIIGASGLIGRELLSLLLEQAQFESVKIFVRKPLGIQHAKLIEILTDFSDLSTLSKSIESEVIFCCLGSTKSKTPNLIQYRKIDHDYPLFFAEEGLKNGLEQFHLVSALGANANSSNFYTKMKGETEEDLKLLNIQSTYIYQPSFLSGDRTEKRPLEKFALSIMKLIDPLLVGSFKKYQSISAITVAKAMINESIKNKRGIFVHKSDQIKELV
jgi:uncharacterized protein YbjT (DUF2867 family)